MTPDDIRAEAARLARRKCAWCGVLFSHGNAARTLCSNRCKKAAYNHRHRERVNARQKARRNAGLTLEAEQRYRERQKVKMRAAATTKREARTRAEVEAEVWSLRERHERQCIGCGCTFWASFIQQVRCKKQCGRPRAERDRRYRMKHADALLRKEREFRRTHPEIVRGRDRARDRRRAAERALSAILLPTTKHPEA